jgi:hypothetical protein
MNKLIKLQGRNVRLTEVSDHTCDQCAFYEASPLKCEVTQLNRSCMAKSKLVWIEELKYKRRSL